MSFIFEALTKQQSKQSESSKAGYANVANQDSQVNVNQAGPDSTHSIASTGMPQTYHPHFAFSWGLVLSLAILGSVVVGFVLGRLSVSVAPVSTIPTAVVAQSSSQNALENTSEKVSVQLERPSKTQANTQPPNQPQYLNENQHQNQSQNQEPSLVQKPVKLVTSYQEKIPEEAYFNNPPVSKAHVANTNVDEINGYTEQLANANIQQETKALPEEDYRLEAVEGVSDDLLAKFQQAIEETGELENDSENLTETAYESEIEIAHLSDKPSRFQANVPRLNFSMHMYSSDINDSWIRVNGQDKFVGDSIGNHIRIIAIEPQHVIMEMQGEQFSLPALSSW